MITQTFRQGAARATVTLFNGDTITLRATLKDADGDAIDLTAKTAYLYAKRDITSSSADISITGSTVTAASGIVDFAFTSTHTATVADYIAEIELNSGTGLDETVCLLNLKVLRGVN